MGQVIERHRPTYVLVRWKCHGSSGSGGLCMAVITVRSGVQTDMPTETWAFWTKEGFLPCVQITLWTSSAFYHPPALLLQCPWRPAFLLTPQHLHSWECHPGSECGFALILLTWSLLPSAAPWEQGFAPGNCKSGQKRGMQGGAEASFWMDSPPLVIKPLVESWSEYHQCCLLMMQGQQLELSGTWAGNGSCLVQAVLAVAHNLCFSFSWCRWFVTI